MALVAAMFVAGNVQAQSTIYATYSPETFVSGNSSENYQGFSIGFSQNIGLYKGLGVAVGGQFRLNTNKNVETLLTSTITTKNTQTIIDVPVMINYDLAINRDFSLIPMAGVMPSIGLTGNYKISTNESITNFTTENETDWYANSNLSRFNLYAVFGLDVKYTNFNLFGGYRLGLLDLDTRDNVSLKTNGWFIGLGYTL
ncbi:MAG: outer membrane beta-barrel protein [Salinivirgaceae bacterium]|nr:outer membrane beta-barrel protein [Salinivirgaceae bacterium]